ncbi:hypothetical protein DXB24_10170 [Lachnospiraceae bacterium OM02-3]|nr:hypothetical protein DXB24_10170 [Lachnospiraceae bacterium OM02-3]
MNSVKAVCVFFIFSFLRPNKKRRNFLSSNDLLTESPALIFFTRWQKSALILFLGACQSCFPDKQFVSLHYIRGIHLMSSPCSDFIYPNFS